MKAMLEARMVAARIHGLDAFAHGALLGADRITDSSQGVLIEAIDAFGA
jgi:hypothetical protein